MGGNSISHLARLHIAALIDFLLSNLDTSKDEAARLVYPILTNIPLIMRTEVVLRTTVLDQYMMGVHVIVHRECADSNEGRLR